MSKINVLEGEVSMHAYACGAGPERGGFFGPSVSRVDSGARACSTTLSNLRRTQLIRNFISI